MNDPWAVASPPASDEAVEEGTPAENMRPQP